MSVTLSIAWPPKYDLFGVQVSATDYGEAVRCTIAAAKEGQPAILSLHAVHALMEASRDAELRAKVNSFDLIGPDGQPVRWALNWLHGARLRERVYGPELTLRICEQAALEGLPVFFYGSTPAVLAALSKRLQRKYAGLVVAGTYSPPFRALTPDEDAEVLRLIRDSGARIVFIGLGAPKQDHFAYEHRGGIAAVQVCVGAAFDFHAGTKAMAPRWMQRSGLEWLFRLYQEPRRLLRRYLETNSIFVWKFLGAMLRRRRTAVGGAGASCSP